MPSGIPKENGGVTITACDLSRRLDRIGVANHNPVRRRGEVRPRMPPGPRVRAASPAVWGRRLFSIPTSPRSDLQPGRWGAGGSLGRASGGGPALAERIGRRALLGRGAAGFLVLAALPAACTRSAAATRLVYTLDPDRDLGGACESGCSACRACRLHAASKLWRTEADIRRAHRNCNCSIVSAAVPAEVHGELFGTPDDPQRGEVDRREAAVQEVLRGAGL